MKDRNATLGAVVALTALTAGLCLAVLDVLVDHVRVVVGLLVIGGALFGALAPRWSVLGGGLLGIALPVVQRFVMAFDLRLPHPMHGLYGGALAIVPPVLSALLAMALRDRIDEVVRGRRRAERAAAERMTRFDGREVLLADAGRVTRSVRALIGSGH